LLFEREPVELRSPWWRAIRHSHLEKRSRKTMVETRFAGCTQLCRKTACFGYWDQAWKQTSRRWHPRGGGPRNGLSWLGRRSSQEISCSPGPVQGRKTYGHVGTLTPIPGLLFVTPADTLRPHLAGTSNCQPDRRPRPFRKEKFIGGYRARFEPSGKTGPGSFSFL